MSRRMALPELDAERELVRGSRRHAASKRTGRWKAIAQLAQAGEMIGMPMCNGLPDLNIS